jgi:hypothetical protein
MINSGYMYKTRINKISIIFSVIIIIILVLIAILLSNNFKISRAILPGFVIFITIVLTGQLYCSIIYVYSEYLLITYPYRFFYKTYKIKYEDVLDMTFRVPVGSRENPRIRVEYKTLNHKTFRFFATDEEMQEIVNHLQKLGVEIKIKGDGLYLNK